MSLDRPLTGGPVDTFDQELMGFVGSKGDELGCGIELYEFHVATLDRAARARLWDALAPVIDATYDLSKVSPEDLERAGANLRRVVEELGCAPELADAFLMTKAEYHDLHVQGGSRGLAAIEAAEAADRLERIRRANPGAHAALVGLIRGMAAAMGVG